MSASLVVQMTTDQLKTLFTEALRDALGGKNLDIGSFSSSAPVKGKRAKKVKDPNAPKKEPNDWIKFTSRVRSVLATEMEDGKKVLPKAVTQVASSLKEASLMPSATDDQIKAAYKNWLANPPAISKMESEGKSKKSKKSVSSDGASTTASDSAPQPSAPSEDAAAEKKRGRKPMSPEAKKAAAEKRAATKAAKAGNAATSVVSAPPAVTEDAAESTMDFEPFTWKKMSLLKNARGDVLTEDMEWFGKWDESAKKVDTSAPQPSDLDL